MLADKKKLIVIGAISVAVLGVGAFMFSRPQGTPPVPTKTTKHANNGAKPEQLSPTADGKNPATGVAGGPASVVADNTPQTVRDPFDGSRYESLPKDRNQSVQPTTTKPPGTQAMAPAQRKAMGVLPVIPGRDINIGPDGTITNPEAIAEMLNGKDHAFNYHLIGVITGIHPVVVFATPDGKTQQLVQLGNSLTPGTKVLAVSRAQATVYNHGQELKMTVGADTPTEKR